MSPSPSCKFQSTFSDLNTGGSLGEAGCLPRAHVQPVPECAESQAHRESRAHSTFAGGRPLPMRKLSRNGKMKPETLGLLPDLG